MEKCPFCGEELDALTRRVHQLETRVSELQAPQPLLSDNQATFGETMYVASKRKSTFHRPNCVYAKHIEMSLNCIYFDSHEEAVEADYKPCKTCRA